MEYKGTLRTNAHEPQDVHFPQGREEHRLYCDMKLAASAAAGCAESLKSKDFTIHVWAEEHPESNQTIINYTFKPNDAEGE